MREQNNSQERMISAAVYLFARTGFCGTTTKDVSELADVSEGNIFRYFPTKRDLFLGAITSELQKLRIRADSLVKLAKAENAGAALKSVFELIAKAMAEQPELVRLLHFSALECGPDTEPLFRQHLRPIVEVLATYMQKWVQNDVFCDSSPTIAVMSFISTVILLQDFYPAFSGSALPVESIASTSAAYAERWCLLLSMTPYRLSADDASGQSTQGLTLQTAQS